MPLCHCTNLSAQGLKTGIHFGVSYSPMPASLKVTQPSILKRACCPSGAFQYVDLQLSTVFVPCAILQLVHFQQLGPI